MLYFEILNCVKDNMGTMGLLSENYIMKHMKLFFVNIKMKGKCMNQIQCFGFIMAVCLMWCLVGCSLKTDETASVIQDDNAVAQIITNLEQLSQENKERVAAKILDENTKASKRAEFYKRRTYYHDLITDFLKVSGKGKTARNWANFTAFSEKFRDYLISEKQMSYMSLDDQNRIQADLNLLSGKILMGEFMVASLEFNHENNVEYTSYLAMEEAFGRVVSSYTACQKSNSIYKDEMFKLTQYYKLNLDFFQNFTQTYQHYQEEVYNELHRSQLDFVNNYVVNNIQLMENHYNNGQGYFDDDENEFIAGLRLANRVLSTAPGDGVTDAAREKASEWAVKFKADLWDYQIKESESVKLTPFVEMNEYPKMSKTAINQDAWARTIRLFDMSIHEGLPCGKMTPSMKM